MYMATNNHKSAAHAAAVPLFFKCRKCLTLLLRSVLDVRNVFHILDFKLFITQMPFTFIRTLLFFRTSFHLVLYVPSSVN